MRYMRILFIVVAALVWALLILAGLHAAYGASLVATVKTIASDGAVLQATNCAVGTVTIGPESAGVAPVLTATIDCRTPLIFVAGFE